MKRRWRGLSGVPKDENRPCRRRGIACEALRRAKWERAFGTLHDAPLDPGLLTTVSAGRGAFRGGAFSYLERPARFPPSGRSGPDRRARCGDSGISMPPVWSRSRAIVYFTRHPLSRPNAANCAIWQSRPEKWGCAIKAFDPKRARKNRPGRSFSDADGSIYDMNLSFDGIDDLLLALLQEFRRIGRSMKSASTVRV